MKEDISKVLVTFPESWSRSKREYVKLVVSKKESDSASSLDNNNPIWIGHKSDFSPNGNKAKIDYDEEDIRKLETAPDMSILEVRSDRGQFRFEKQNGKWAQVGE